jgi:outer membrane protein OmpA-like peptidoglycan-associated protein
VALLLPASCGGPPNADPVTWWHDLEGGPISDARPPPPNADQPYPTLGGIPTGKPALLSAQARLHIANALVADRANAQYGAAMAPLPPPAPRPAVPRPPPAATGDDVSSAAMPAANAPAPKPAPTGPVQTASLPPPDTLNGTPEAGVPPAMPAAPPPPPNLPGVPQATSASAPPVAPPPPPAPQRPLVAGAPAPVAFPRGSATLPTSAYAALKSLAQQRGGGSIAVVGFGDAAGGDPAAQQAALPLALARARAIATYLEASGVPAGSLRIDAEAAGSGGLARLVN